MKKIFFLLLIPFAVFSCKQTDYCKTMEDKIQQFADFVKDSENNVDLSIEQVEHRVDSAYEVFSDELLQMASEAVRKHSADSVALQAIGILKHYQITDDEGLEKYIALLSPELQQTPEIQAIKDAIEKSRETAPGQPFKDFSVVQPDGKVLKLSDFAGKGKYCLVDFWASWCGPCRREIPNIKEVYEDYAKKGLVVVSVAVWDNPDDSRTAAESLGISWNQILGAGGDVTQAYMIEGIPHIMLIGPDGTILHRDLRGKEIARTVGKYL